jgi:hypothetical protein
MEKLQVPDVHTKEFRAVPPPMLHNSPSIFLGWFVQHDPSLQVQTVHNTPRVTSCSSGRGTLRSTTFFSLHFLISQH